MDFIFCVIVFVHSRPLIQYISDNRKSVKGALIPKVWPFQTTVIYHLVGNSFSCCFRKIRHVRLVQRVIYEMTCFYNTSQMCEILNANSVVRVDVSMAPLNSHLFCNCFVLYHFYMALNKWFFTIHMKTKTWYWKYFLCNRCLELDINPLFIVHAFEQGFWYVSYVIWPEAFTSQLHLRNKMDAVKTYKK